MGTITYILLLIPIILVLFADPDVLKRLKNGITTRKEDLKINWEKLKEAENKL